MQIPDRIPVVRETLSSQPVIRLIDDNRTCMPAMPAGRRRRDTFFRVGDHWQTPVCGQNRSHAPSPSSTPALTEALTEGLHALSRLKGPCAGSSHMKEGRRAPRFIRRGEDQPTSNIVASDPSAAIFEHRPARKLTETGHREFTQRICFPRRTFDMVNIFTRSAQIFAIQRMRSVDSISRG